VRGNVGVGCADGEEGLVEVRPTSVRGRCLEQRRARGHSWPLCVLHLLLLWFTETEL
jgi:hypothetical protein